MEYSVLFSHLKSACIAGKAWCLISTKIWSSVLVKGVVSSPFFIHCGFCQGSVLSPVLFLLPHPFGASIKPCGLNINGLFLGALSHADDITLTTNFSTVKHQITTVISFATSRGHFFKVQKYVKLLFLHLFLRIELQYIYLQDKQHWNPYLSVCMMPWSMVVYLCHLYYASGSRYKKLKVSFFLGEMVSSMALQKSLVLKEFYWVLCASTTTVRCKWWILNTLLLMKLESFQAEIGKQMPNNHNARLALQWPFTRAHALSIILDFLLEVVRNSDILSSGVFQSLSGKALHLVRQFQYLESTFNLNFTSILSRQSALLRYKKKSFKETLNFSQMP